MGHKSWLAFPLMLVLGFVLLKGIFTFAVPLALLAVAWFAFRAMREHGYPYGWDTEKAKNDDDLSEKPKRRPTIIVADRDSIDYV